MEPANGAVDLCPGRGRPGAGKIRGIYHRARAGAGAGRSSEGPALINWLTAPPANPMLRLGARPPYPLSQVGNTPRTSPRATQAMIKSCHDRLGISPLNGGPRCGWRMVSCSRAALARVSGLSQEPYSSREGASLCTSLGFPPPCPWYLC